MPLCPKCGKENSEIATFCQACGTMLGAASNARPSTPPPAPAAQIYGGFWKRVAAWFIDAVIVSAGTGLVLAASVGVAFPVIFLGHWIYEAYLHSSPWQATLGKRALNMVVTGMNGERISFARATGRYFAEWLSAMTLGIGFVMAAFTAKKQGLHDIITETLVVNR